MLKHQVHCADVILGVTPIAARIKIPAIAIAGITAENVDEVMASGINAIAVSSAIIGRDDVRAATVTLKTRLV